MTARQGGGHQPPTAVGMLATCAMGAMVWLLALQLAKALGAPHSFVVVATWVWGLLALVVCGGCGVLAVGDLVAAYRDAKARDERAPFRAYCLDCPWRVDAPSWEAVADALEVHRATAHAEPAPACTCDGVAGTPHADDCPWLAWNYRHSRW